MSFRDFEYEGWQKVANRYHDSFAGVTVQCIPNLLDAAHINKGSRVLDVACGPGYAAGAAAGRGADVVGIDFSSGMLAEARHRYPGIRFEEGDAEQLQFAADSFDAVIMNFGMLHLGYPEKAMAEAHRVLRPGGRFAFTVWDTPDKAKGFGIVLNAIRTHGDMNVPIPPGPPFFRFADPNETRTAMESAGFSQIESTIVPQVWRLESADKLFDIMMNASVRNAALLRGQSPEVLELIRDEIRRGFKTELPMPAVLNSGARHPNSF